MSVAAALVMGAFGGAAPRPAGAAPAESGIEAAYELRGAWGALVADTASVPGYTIYAPADLGAGGHLHAVVLWGNGTEAPSDVYLPLFDQLTSWGYVVVAADDGWVGGGDELVAGLAHIVAEGNDPSSRYAGVVDGERVGAMGHSQGAGGALWAAVDLDGRVDSYLGWALPDRLWWCFPVPWPADEGRCREDPTPADLAGLSTPSLLIRGAGDLLAATALGNRAWYDDLPGPAARATVKAGDHTNLDATYGYVTAWFRYTLDGDPAARAAFAGPTPELATNPAWTGWAARDLP
jgi:hypothetical protein